MSRASSVQEASRGRPAGGRPRTGPRRRLAGTPAARRPHRPPRPYGRAPAAGRRHGLPGLDAAARGAGGRGVHGVALPGKGGHDLVLAVAVEVGELDVVPPATSRIGRDPGHLAGEEPLAIPEEDPDLAYAGQGHQVELAVAVQIAHPERRDVVLALARDEGPALPLAAGAGVEDVDPMPPDPELQGDVADRQVGAAVVIEVPGCDGAHVGVAAHVELDVVLAAVLAL